MLINDRSSHSRRECRLAGSITNPFGQISLLGYDAAGRLETTSNPLAETVAQSYDSAGNRTGLQNARLNNYQFAFTANNLEESLTTPLGRVFNYTYDDRLLLESVEEPSGETVTYHYFDDGLLQQTVDPTGTIDFAYDSKGRLETVTEGTDTLTRSYAELAKSRQLGQHAEHVGNSLDRVTSFTDSQGNTISYEYDGGDNLTTLTYPGSKGDVDYKYDEAGRLVKVTDWAARETEFFYEGDSRLVEMRLPNGTKREYFYDSAGRVERQIDTHIASDIVLLEQQYEFDALSRIVEERVSPEPATYVITPALMTYDDDDRITNWQSGAANIDPVFDLDGNMTTGVLEGAPETFVYDSRNRLTQAASTIYTYDAEDRRISKTESGVTTTYVHDPHAPLSRLLQKTTGDVTTYYVYAGGQLLYEETGGQITAYHFDSRGSTLALTDSSGAVVNRITYGTYGEIVATTVPPTTPFLYNGAYGVQTDANGLLHMRARYYSTELRRFINSDPIGFAGGMNWYQYAAGNPFTRIDPSGTASERTITGSAFARDSVIANLYSQSELDFFNANGYFNTGPTVYIRDNYSQHIPAVASLVVGGPTVIRASFTKASSASRNLMNLLTNTPARTTAIRTGTMQFDDALIATSRMVQSENSAGANISQTIFSNTVKYSFELEAAESGLSFLNGLSGNAPNPMEPSVLDFLPNNVLFDQGNSFTNTTQAFGNFLSEF